LKLRKESDLSQESVILSRTLFSIRFSLPARLQGSTLRQALRAATRFQPRKGYCWTETRRLAFGLVFRGGLLYSALYAARRSDFNICYICSPLRPLINVMTRDTQIIHDDRNPLSGAEVYAALWAAAPFPRLPHDAPNELKKLTIDVEDPKRVYAIHRASRRHHFQILVERLVSLEPSCLS
jgi:hypothetical protein